MKNQKKNGDIIVQAGILAAAGIISRIIGLLYRSPLHGIIGDLGLGYYQEAYEYYTIILLISSYSIPSAISKVIAQKLAIGEYRNAHKIFRCSLFYVLAVGGIASIFLFLAAGLFVQDAAIPVLRMFAPTIFLYGILGVLRGYFQAHNSMMQTSVSQITEQIVNAVVSVTAAYFMIRVAMGGIQVPADETGQMNRAVQGAMGSALGTGMGVIAALLFMLWVYSLNAKTIKRRIQKDRSLKTDSYGTVIKEITFVVLPFILSTAVCNLSSTVNTTIYTKLYPTLGGRNEMEVTQSWGVFSGQALTISNIPIAFASAMAAAILPSVASLVAAKKMADAKNRIALATKTTMMISIPCAVGLFVLGKPVTSLLFSNKPEVMNLMGRLLMALSLSVVFFALSTLNSSVLQGIGKVRTPIYHAAAALLVQSVVACVLLFTTGLGLYSIAIANTVYSGMMCVLNHLAVQRAIGYRQEVKKTFLIPALCSALMGLAAFGFYETLFLLTDSMRISGILAILVAVFAYFWLMILFQGVTEEELLSFPKGDFIIRIAKRLYIIRSE